MFANTPLPGFERLITICRRHALPVELSPPLASSPNLEERLFDQPIDPLLMTLYKSVGGATLGSFSLLRPDMEWDGLIPWNAELRRDEWGPFCSILVFGKETGFSYYFGTVPALANTKGFQPIVYASAYSGELSAVPVASNLDQFFDVYSHFLELIVADVGYIGTGVPEVHFPWSVSSLIAQDELLMALTRAGRFSHLFQHDEGARKWVAEVLSISPNAP